MTKQFSSLTEAQDAKDGAILHKCNSDGTATAFYEDDPLPEPTAEEILAAKAGELQQAVQSMLDAQAQAMGYDSIFTAVTYAEEPAVKRFQDKGKKLRAWRSAVWAACYSILADVQAGKRQPPTLEELVGELPKLP